MNRGVRTQLGVVLAASSLAIYFGSRGNSFYTKLGMMELVGTIVFVGAWAWAAYLSGKRRAAVFWGFALAYWAIPAILIAVLDFTARFMTSSASFWASVRLLASYFIFTTIYAVIYMTYAFGISEWYGVAAVVLLIAFSYAAGARSRRYHLFYGR